MELAKILAAFTPGAYGIWTGVLMLAGWFVKEWRETRKLSSDDRLARREGYAKQVEMLMNENRALGEDLAKLRHEYDGYRAICHTETDQLRSYIIKLEGEQAGYKRKLDMQAIDIARLKAQVNIPPVGSALPPSWTPDV